MKKIRNLNDLLVEQVNELHLAKKEQLRELPRFMTLATSPKLKQTIEKQIEAVKKQTFELETVLNRFTKQPVEENNWGFKGIMRQYKEVVEMSDNPKIKDVSIINALQHMNHYDIAGFGSVSTYAQELKFSEESKKLRKFLNDEVEIDKMLTKIAVEDVNPKAITV